MTALTSPRTLSAAHANRRVWALALISVALSLGLVAPFYSREITWAVHVWIDSTAYNHCFLVLPIVAYLVWTRRHTVADLAPRPSPVGLVAVVALSVVWLLAAKLDVIEARQFLFVAIVQAILFILLGAKIYRRLLGPLLYLFFLVPSGEFLVPRLQEVTAHFAVAGLRATGVPVYSDGVFIQIPEGLFVIAEACAGLRFLIASIAYGVLFALIVYTSWWRRAAFIGLSIIVPVIANGLRAFGIVFAAHVIGSAQAAEADHILYGWLFFSIVIFLLTLLGLSFARTNPSLAFTNSSAEINPSPSRGPLRPAFRGTIAGLAVVLAIAAPLLLLGTRGTPHGLAATQADFPGPAEPWRAVAAAPEWRPVLTGTDGEFLHSFTDGQSVVESYVALYSSERNENIAASLGRSTGPATWEKAGSHDGIIAVGEHTYPIEVSEIHSGDRVRLVWSFYIVSGRVIASTLGAKLLEGYTSLLGDGNVVAFVALSTPVGEGTREASETLESFVKNLRSLDQYIARVH